MIGTFINLTAIVAGVVAGLSTPKDLPPAWQLRLKQILGALTVWFGLRMVWQSFNGGFGPIIRQFLLLMGALMIGKLLGRLLRIQRLFNRLGQYAKKQLTQTVPEPRRFAEGFTTGSILFCVAPLATLGALHEGLTGDIRPLLVKACMDGLAAMAFARILGPGVALAVLPVLALQGSLALLGQGLEPWLHKHALVDSLEAAMGYMVFCVSLVILDLRRVEISDYLPSLAIAPLLAWWAR